MTPDLDSEPEQDQLPTVGVVLVNLNGADHLPDCLDSLAAQDYPAHLLDVVLVDNASTDGSRELLAHRYPWVRVLPQETNTGFAPAVNAGARELDSECVVLLNNDARADPSFLRELVRQFDLASDAVCVGARILSWDGETIDFVGGAVNYYGMGQQLAYGRPVGDVGVEDGAELLFACGGAMLVHRQTFLDLGGLDPAFFAYFEDVDFGWRLWVAGFRVVLAPRALAYHRMHGTSGRFPLHQRYVLYERNALRMVIKNYSDENLGRVLAPALLLVVKRALLRGDLARAPYDIAGDKRTTERVPRLVLAHLHAIGDIVDDLDALMLTRAEIQQGRKRSDDDILWRFKRPMWPVMDDSAYVRASESVSRAFGLDAMFAERQAAHLLVVCTEDIDEPSGARAVRAVEIARHLTGDTAVTLAVPNRPRSEVRGVTVAVFEDGEDLRRLARAADVVVFQGHTTAELPHLIGTSAVLVADLADPGSAESVEPRAGAPDADLVRRNDSGVPDQVLDECDFFICATEQERDHWLGLLTARQRVPQARSTTGRASRDLIDVVAFGPSDQESAPGSRGSAAVAPLHRVLVEPWRWERPRAHLPAGGSTEELRALYEDAAHRRGQVVSGPRATVAADRAAMQRSIETTERILREHPHLVRAVHRVRKAGLLGPRGTAGYLRDRLGKKLARRRR